MKEGIICLLSVCLILALVVIAVKPKATKPGPVEKVAYIYAQCPSGQYVVQVTGACKSITEDPPVPCGVWEGMINVRDDALSINEITRELLGKTEMETIDVGVIPNSGTGDTYDNALKKIFNNFRRIQEKALTINGAQQWQK